LDRTWTKGTDIDLLKEQDPGLGIAASVPVHRLGVPEEVSNIVSMYVTSPIAKFLLTVW
jgi:3-oxoacyl-[acyl-carrier protein] reductase